MWPMNKSSKLSCVKSFKLLWLLTRKKIFIENKMSVPHNGFQRIFDQTDYK